METDTADRNADTNFVWPSDPPQDWWEAQGAALGLDGGQTKFSAALFQLGGADSRKNSQAAKLARLPWDRVQAFRQARSVAVRKLLTEAADIKRGKREPLTETEIDEKIDDLIRCPDALTVARGIELREKRRAARAKEQEDRATQIKADPIADLKDLATRQPRLAALIAKDKGIPWDESTNAPLVGPVVGGTANAQ